MTVAAIATALDTRLSTISGLRVYPFVPDSIVPPAAVIGVPSVEFDTYSGTSPALETWTVHVLVGRASDRTAFTDLAAYLAKSGTKSVRAALEGDPTLGGLATARLVRAIPSTVTVAGTDYLAATFDVEVYDRP